MAGNPLLPQNQHVTGLTAITNKISPGWGLFLFSGMALVLGGTRFAPAVVAFLVAALLFQIIQIASGNVTTVGG